MNISRRKLLKGASMGLIAGSASGVAFAKNNQDAFLKAVNAEELSGIQWSLSERSRDNYIRRVRAIGANLLDAFEQPEQEVNVDELNIPGFVGNFSKTLAHNNLGEVDENAYLLLVDGLATGDFSQVVLSDQADRKLANPTAFRSLELHGGFPETTRITKAPETQSAHAAAEMIEVYWQALTRDVPFSQYGSSSMIASAVADLNNASYSIGPTTGGSVTSADIFRGSTFGDSEGPYISQLLTLPFNYGASYVEQRYTQPVANLDYMVDFDEFLAIQNGAAPSVQETFGGMRYIQNNRDLANYVHTDVLFQAYYNGTMILLQSGGLVDDNSPFAGSSVEGGFVTFGGPDILSMVVTAARMALTGAWYHKWLHRKLRPEAYAGLVDVQRRGLADYGLHSDIMSSSAVSQTLQKQGNALLSQTYPEGSPTHPSYPAGHACVAGACTTVMKAWFKEDALFPNPMEPNSSGTALVPLNNVDLTVGGEINKLANNISIGRNAAGVHYRSDGEQGMYAGEQQAIGLLRDYSLTYSNAFDGFQLTKFDGTRIKIYDGKVIEI
ncbi:MAG: vanadium-dependent haloperoxidase [Marinicellaceae bacterium]